MSSALGHMVLDARPRNLTIKASREFSGDRAIGILPGSKIHLLYNCPDVFIDPCIRWGRGEVRATPLPLCRAESNPCRKMRKTAYLE